MSTSPWRGYLMVEVIRDDELDDTGVFWSKSSVLQ